eukprot:GHVS01019082.1.p1 GENE.GHVS01019082.1~~GHVS01019082.1.p1  ORF type:complete len:165 (+),score=21.14 GHVS01019082.1:539-1033(+)
MGSEDMVYNGRKYKLEEEGIVFEYPKICLESWAAEPEGATVVSSEVPIKLMFMGCGFFLSCEEVVVVFQYDLPYTFVRFERKQSALKITDIRNMTFPDSDHKAFPFFYMTFIKSFVSEVKLIAGDTTPSKKVTLEQAFEKARGVMKKHYVDFIGGIKIEEVTGP